MPDANVMKNLRTYGAAPFAVAIIHGGPGGAGEVAPVARELSANGGVLEPLQTVATLTGQIEELQSVLEQNGNTPIVLVGFSWGAWLSYLVAARHPELVKKLILVSSGPYDEHYADIHRNRMARLGEEEQTEVQALSVALDDVDKGDKNLEMLMRLDTLMTKADTYDALPEDVESVEYRADIYAGVWPAAADLRKSGELLRFGECITCPVVAIHGDYDPHPAEGVQKPLSGVLEDFRFILLENCGHKPWIERYAKDAFYQVLRKEVWS